MGKSAGNKVKKRFTKTFAGIQANSEIHPKNILTSIKSNIRIYSNLLSRELDSGIGFTSKTGYGKIVRDVSRKNDFDIGDLTSIFSRYPDFSHRTCY